jgi:hypothetical protein
MLSTQWHRCPHCRKINAGQSGPDTNCQGCKSPTFCPCPACGERLLDHQSICCSCRQPLSWNGNYPVAKTLNFFKGEEQLTFNPEQKGTYELGFDYLPPNLVRSIVQQHNTAFTKEPNNRLAARTSIVLRNTRTLSRELAEELQHTLGGIHLPDVVRLDIDAARCLASHAGPLYLDSLTTLEEDLAFALSKHPGRLSFGNLETISAAAASALTEHTGVLALHRLKEISPEAAAAVSEHAGGIELDNLDEDNTPATLRARLYTRELRNFTASLTHLEEDFAEHLCRKNGSRKLMLDGLKTLTTSTAKTLAASAAEALSLNGLQTIRPDVASELGQFRGTLLLNGVTHIESSAMHSLTQSPCHISMRSIMKLPTQWLSTSGSRSWDLHLYGITAMLPSAASRLTAFSGTIRFDRGNWLSKPLFEILKNAKGQLIIEDEQSVSGDLQEEIKKAGGAFKFAPVKTELQRILKRIQKRSEHSDVAAQRIVLKDTTSVTAEEARQLASWPGEIEFSKGIDLDADIAQALATHGGTLILRMQSTLDEPVLRHLIRHRGLLMFFGDYVLTEQHIDILVEKHAGEFLPDPGAFLSLRNDQKQRLRENPRIRIDA